MLRWGTAWGVRFNSKLAQRLKETPVPLKPNQKNALRRPKNDQLRSLLQQKHHLTNLRPVTSITIGESIDLEKTSRIFAKHNLPHRILVPNEVLTWSLKDENVMVLANGTIVGWGMTEQRMLAEHVPLVAEAVEEKYEPESEEMDYVIVPGHDETAMVGDVFVVHEDKEHDVLLEMAAFAIGLSRSTRLSILEESLEKHIELARENSEALSQGLKVKTTESDILKLTGRLFLIRGKLNLYLELIETPDLYWSEPVLERIYEAVGKRLDMALRISIMNRKLDYITEEQRALLSVLNEKKLTRLEWIIILLIMVEVLFEIVHFVEKYIDSRTNEELT